MRWRPALALMLLAAPLRAQAPDPGSDGPPLVLRLAVAPAGPVWVGQRIAVTLTALTPLRFADPPSWPDLAATQGRMILLPEGGTVPGVDRVDGKDYVALQHTYSVFAAEAGPLVIAPVAMALRVGGPNGQPVEAHAATPENRITVRLPPGVSDVTRLVVAPSFRMTAAIEGDVRQLRAGQAVVRTLRMQADDTTSMLLPAGAWGSPEGVRVYPDPPVLQDRSERGIFHASRSERVAFVPERAGPLELPGFAVTWFDPRSGRSREVRTDAVRLEVLPADAPGTETGTTAGRWPALLGAAGMGLLIVGGIAWGWRRRSGPHRCEAPPITALARACRSGDAQAAVRALYRWSDAVRPPGGERTIAALARQAGVPALAREAQALEDRAFGARGSRWTGSALLDAARRTERALRNRARQVPTPALPALNPAAAPRPAPRMSQPRWVR